MKPQYLVTILFATSLYWLYLLYSPFILVITIASLLAISTSSIEEWVYNRVKSKLLSSAIVSLLLATMFFAPLGYFLATLSIKLNTIEPDKLMDIVTYIKNFITDPPEFLQFLKPYSDDILKSFNLNSLSTEILPLTASIGTFSAGFLKNALLIIIFYFFAQYNGVVVVGYLKRVVQMSVKETDLLAKELSSVMSVVFYSIIINATLQGALFGIAISFMGYNGLLFGVMYGFASLIPVIGGVIMWLPFMIYELYIGNTGGAIFIAVYTVVLISLVADTFIKPLIIKDINRRLLKEDDAKMDELLIFFAIIAGLTTFGFWGMILGPAITAFFLTILKLFEARSQECVS